MKGDFSRLTFDPRQSFTRVLMQQGRVQLDADWNEQTSILLHYLRTLARDLIGPHGGPAGDAGFAIVPIIRNGVWVDFTIGEGSYWVAGIPCENREDLRYTRHRPGETVPNDGPRLVYLEVWERHLTHLDGTPNEVALGGPDTATRAKVEWRVKIAPPGVDEVDDLRRHLGAEPFPPRLTARLKSAPISQDPCTMSPESRYRGPENQLYRVEVHRGSDPGPATFKWSRENGSVVLPVRSVKGTRLEVDHLGRDSRLSLGVGDWVEVFDEAHVREEKAEELLRVEDVDRVDQVITLSGTPEWIDDDAGNVQVRRWDHRKLERSAGGFDLDEGAGVIEEGRPLALEKGLEILFHPMTDNDGNVLRTEYRTGDYWLIPARTATGDIEWPPPGRPVACPPLGVKRFYAPLAKIGDGDPPVDLRRLFPALAHPPGP